MICSGRDKIETPEQVGLNYSFRLYLRISFLAMAPHRSHFLNTDVHYVMSLYIYVYISSKRLRRL